MNWVRALAAPLLLTANAQSAPPPANQAMAQGAGLSSIVEGLDGDWDGSLPNMAFSRVRLVFHIVTTANGTAVTVDSIDEEIGLAPVASITRVDKLVALKFKGGRVNFEGMLSPDGQTISGTWSTNLLTPLVLTRRKAGAPIPTPYRRPQNPVKPYPYQEELVTFTNPAASGTVRLAGTLTLPRGKGPFPAVILIAGSGWANRDEETAGHKPFLILADRLTRQGIAVLRYDKRGCAQSTGSFAEATIPDFASDVRAALIYLRGRSDIAKNQIGLIGHSEGGMAAPIVAGDNPEVGFVVLMGSPGVNGLKIQTTQDALIARAKGQSEKEIAEYAAAHAPMYRVVLGEPDAAKRGAELREMITAADKAHRLKPQAVDAQAKEISNDWNRFFLAYDPAPMIALLKQPVLALIGSADILVPPGDNLPPIRAALAHNEHAVVKELPGLNHMFQTSRGGPPDEYQSSEETIAPFALDLIMTWVAAQVHLAKPL
jgi:pimeloyl-ACP methyl ester carboxylesterase